MTSWRGHQHAALARSEARYRALLDHLPDTVAIVYDRQMRAVVAAGGGLTSRGFAANAMVGKHVNDLVDPEDLSTLLPLYRDAFEGRATSTEFRSRSTGVDNLLDVVPVPAPAGQRILEILVVARDVGALKDRERALMAADVRWNTAFESAPVGIAELALDGRFTRVNAALCTTVGYTAKQLLARTPVDIAHPDDAEQIRKGLLYSVRPDVERFRDEKRFLHGDGHAVWCSFSVVKMRDAAQQTDHLLVHYLDITELKRVEADLRHLAIHDSLTGLLNRRGFDDCFERHVAQVQRYGAQGALLMIDVDGLKLINDHEGHEAGDRALVAVAEVLRHRLRTTDSIARVGGDEFAVILPHADREAANGLASSIIIAIRLRCPATASTRAVTASIGGSFFDTPGQSGDQVRSEADASMYQAKRAGRDRHELFPAAPDGDAQLQPIT